MTKKTNSRSIYLSLCLIIFMPRLPEYIKQNITENCYIRQKQQGSRILGFNYSDFFLKYRQYKKYQKKEIVVNGLKNTSIRKKLAHATRLYLPDHISLDQDALREFLVRLHLSGFFKSVDIYSYRNLKKQVLYVDVDPYSIIKMVFVKDATKKLINLSTLQHIFKDQIGYPLNLKYLQHKVNTIKHWYNKQGYTNTKIKLSYEISKPSSVNVHIDEYLVKQISIVIISSDVTDKQIYNETKRHFTNYLVYQIDRPFNLNRIEQYIASLQRSGAIYNCYYKLHRQGTITNNVKMSLYIRPTYNRSINIIIKKVLFTEYALELVEHLLNLDLYSYILGRNFITNAINYDLYMTHSLTYSSYWNAVYTIFKRENFCGLRYLVRNICFTNSLLSLDTVLCNKRTYYRFKCELPAVCFLKNLMSSISLVLTNQVDLFYPSKSGYVLSGYYKKSKSSFVHDSSASQHNLSVTFDYALWNYIKISTLYNLQEIKYRSTLLYANIEWLDFLATKLNTQSYASHKYFRNSYRRHLHRLTFYLPFRVLNHKNLSEQFYACEYNYIVQDKLYIPTKDQFKSLTSHNLTTKVNICGQVFNLAIKCINYQGCSEGLNSLTSLTELSYWYTGDYLDKDISVLKNLKTCKLEYSLPHLGSYVFASYLSHPIEETYHTKHIKQLGVSFNRNIGINYGIGIKISMPFKQIPALRLEYVYNINALRCLHIRVDS
uniref:POTRA domain-containing protein n=1 Tax=Yamadaella caenomyce TaxID=259029 RepID=A0A1G4NYR0_9FLOR|nr:Hypothetical protein ORF_4 [Yamadaella caenomyce]SCW23782.1 Hypothetical protein ORF_4 [Yamadaella caenomyce]